MLGETEFTLDIRPTFVDELDKAATYIERKFKDFLAAICFIGNLTYMKLLKDGEKHAPRKIINGILA